MIGTLVRVHVNLTRGDFTLCAPKSPYKKIGSAHDVTITDVTFKVSEKGRQYCITKQGRWVHAWAFGTLAALDTDPDVTDVERVTYNPFRAPTFTLTDGTPVHTAPAVAFVGRYGYLTKPIRDLFTG